MLDDIIRMTESLKKDMESNIPILEREIDSIIENKVESSERIERMLDTLLDYSHMGLAMDQFQRLNSYYASVCPEYSKEYDGFFEDIFRE